MRVSPVERDLLTLLAEEEGEDVVLDWDLVELVDLIPRAVRK